MSIEIVERELSRHTIFKDEGKLSIDYVPEVLPHREEELRKLVSYFRPVVENPTSISQRVVIVGPIGTGKTATSKLFGRALVERISKTKGSRFYYVHVNCHKERTIFNVARRIACSVIPSLPSRGFSAPDYLNAVLAHVQGENAHLVATLDEVDFLIVNSGRDSLYQLFRVADDELYNRACISIILISRTLNFLELLEDDVSTILQRKVVKFNRYDAKQLYDILMHRARLALHDGTYSSDIIEMIADIAEEKGDARYAIEILWRAAKHADIESSQYITPEHVRRAKSEVSPTYSKESLLYLSLHELMFLLAVVHALKGSETPYVPMGDAEKSYRSLCERFSEAPRRHTQVWEYMKRLEMLGLLTAKLSTKGRRGRTTLIGLPDVPLASLERDILELLGLVKER